MPYITNERRLGLNYHSVDTKGITVAGSTRTYHNIAERDQVNKLERPTFAWVEDATGDPTVNAGSALYFNKGNAWVKLYETEVMDQDLTLKVDWSQVTNKPNSSPEDIDLVVTAYSELEARLSELENKYVWVEL